MKREDQTPNDTPRTGGFAAQAADNASRATTSSSNAARSSHAAGEAPQHSFMEDIYGLSLRLDKAYAKLASRHGETYYNLWAIDELGRAEAGLTQKELANLLLAPKQTISSIVNGLERRGLVETLPSPTDGRSKVHRLTEEGRCLFDKADADQIAAEERCIERVGGERIADMFETMESFIACIEESFSEDAGKERMQQHSSTTEPNGNESEKEQR